MTRPPRRRRRGVAATPSTPSREMLRSGFVGAAAVRHSSLRRRPEVYYFEKWFVEEVQTAGDARLAELTRTHKGARLLCRDAARLAADLDLKHGLRCRGDGQSKVVPHAYVLRYLFRRERILVGGDNYVTVEGTIFCSLGFAVCDANGAPLLVKGVGITADSLAKARAARNKLVAHRPKYVADLVEADRLRDVARAARAAGASPKPMMRAPGGPRANKTFPAIVAAALEDPDDAITWDVEKSCIIVHRDKAAALRLLNRVGWTGSKAKFATQLNDYGFAHHSTVEFLRHARWTNPDVASVDDIPGMKMKKKTKKRKAKGTGPATAPKRTRVGDAS